MVHTGHRVGLRLRSLPLPQAPFAGHRCLSGAREATDEEWMVCRVQGHGRLEAP